MCSSTCTAKQSLRPFCVGFSVPLRAGALPRHYTTSFFFSFAQCGAVSKVAQELKYTCVIGQSMSLFLCKVVQCKWMPCR